MESESIVSRHRNSIFSLCGLAISLCAIAAAMLTPAGSIAGNAALAAAACLCGIASAALSATDAAGWLSRGLCESPAIIAIAIALVGLQWLLIWLFLRSPLRLSFGKRILLIVAVLLICGGLSFLLFNMKYGL